MTARAGLALRVLVLLALVQAAAAAQQVARDSWGQVPKSIAIHPGTSVSVWNTASRSQITNGAAAMTAVGDGTYEYIVGLSAGQSYNYLFYANPGGAGIQGLQAWNEYYDIVPTSGGIRCGRNAPVYNDTSAYYASVSYDARRVLTVPSNMNPGETLWVFNNWGETPGTIANFTGSGNGDTAILLSWSGPYGFWGTGGEAFKAADVLAGGKIEIYRSSSPLTGYTLRDTVPGGTTSYIDTGLAPGSYFYMVRAVDAYKGLGTGNDSYYTLHGGYDSPTLNGYIQCTTTLPINSFFLVQGGDWNYIQEHNNIAWFSRPGDGPWSEKFAAPIVAVTLPDRRVAVDTAPLAPVAVESAAALPPSSAPSLAGAPAPGATPPPESRVNAEPSPGS